MSRVFLGRGYGMDTHNSTEWKKLCAMEDRYRLVAELKEKQKDPDGTRRADTAALDMSGLAPVRWDGALVGWVNRDKVNDTFRPRTRFPSPPPLPFARIKEIQKPDGKGAIKVTHVYTVPKYGPTQNSQYGTTYHQKAIPEHWTRPKEVEYPGTVVKATAGHFLKDDGFWEYGRGRPSRVGRPLWHTFGPRPETVRFEEGGDSSQRLLTGFGQSALSARETVSRAKEVEDLARSTERRATAMVEQAQQEIQGLKWVRSLGFLLDKDAGQKMDPSQSVPRPATRTLQRLIPQDQHGLQSKTLSIQATSTWPEARQPTAGGVRTQTLGSRAAARTAIRGVEVSPQKEAKSPTSPRSPRHKDFVPSFPATLRRTYEHTHQLQPLPDYRGKRTLTAMGRDRKERARQYFFENTNAQDTLNTTL
eukprot:Tamp_15064.p1 GENE.Tamp_15064~~Tamp_15064.p1  ORF type:complete len:435 (+),score=38.76 Tamp_15064:51-1307(+)